MALPTASNWEHEGTYSTEATAGTVDDDPTAVAEDDVAVLLVVCRPGGISMEHPRSTSKRT
jgi:hypothetical protein